MGVERRTYRRVTITSVAEVNVLPANQRFFAFVGGVSRGGLEIYCQQALRVTNPVTIHLTFLNRQGQETKETLTGTIRWCSKLGEAYIAGVEFKTLLEEKAHPALWAYIAQSGQAAPPASV